MSPGEITTNFEEDALISDIKAVNKELGVELSFKDFVDSQYTAFCRYITLSNKTDKEVEVRDLFAPSLSNIPWRPS